MPQCLGGLPRLHALATAGATTKQLRQCSQGLEIWTPEIPFSMTPCLEGLLFSYIHVLLPSGVINTSRTRNRVSLMAMKK